MATYDITTRGELMEAVRSETLYSDESDELPQDHLDQLVANAMMLVHAKAGSDQWFSDRGMGLILLGYTCAKAKAAVENMTVDEFSLDPIRIVARDSSGNEVQFSQYEQMVKTGLQSTDVTLDRGQPTLSVSNSWITSDPTPNS